MMWPTNCWWFRVFVAVVLYQHNNKTLFYAKAQCDSNPPSNCDLHFNSNANSYAYHAQAVLNYDTSKSCTLASIVNSAETDFIISKLSEIANVDNAAWLGGRRKVGASNPTDPSSATWEWIDGSEWCYTKWVASQPDNNVYGPHNKQEDVVVTWGNDASWNDVGDDSVLNYMWPAFYKCCRIVVEPFFDFDVTVDHVDINLDTSTDFEEAIVFQYSYTGYKPSETSKISFTYDIFKDDCSTAFALANDTSKALFFTEFNESVTDKVSAKLGINLTMIETASDVWTHPNSDETQAMLKFCGRWNIYVDGNLFQFHDTSVNATINLKEDGGFNVDGLSVGLDRINADALNEDIAIDFPVDVFFCHNNATRMDPPSDGFTQGDPIQVCLQLETATDNVFVQSIHSMSYNATQTGGDAVTLIDDGAIQFAATTEVSCVQLPGVCRVKFLASADKFVNTENNNLALDGWALVAFGTDPDRRRRIAFTRESGKGRSMLEGEEDSKRLAPFQFTLSNLQPNTKEKTPGTEHVVLFSVVGILVGLVIVALGSASFFMIYHNNDKQGNKPAVDGPKSSKETSVKCYRYEIREV